MILKILKKIRERILMLSMSKENYARYKGVTIGKGCSIESRLFGSEPYLIELGNRVQITDGVSFLTHGGGWVFREEMPNFDFFGKIKIGNNVYIGNDVKIMPGVTIGDNVIIGAGTIITKSFGSNNVIVGCPGKAVKKVDDLKKSLIPYNVSTKGMNSRQKRKFLEELDDNKFIKK